jgi:hypothetical protein
MYESLQIHITNYEYNTNLRMPTNISLSHTKALFVIPCTTGESRTDSKTRVWYINRSIPDSLSQSTPTSIAVSISLIAFLF